MKILNSAPSVGEIIQELYLQPTGLSVQKAATLCQMTAAEFIQILDNKSPIGYEQAYHLAQGFNTTHHFWLNIQRDYLAENSEG